MAATLMEKQEERLRELERGLAYEFAVSVLDGELPENDGWFDGTGNSREDELVPECVEYLDMRGLIQRKIGSPNLFRVLDESEAI